MGNIFEAIMDDDFYGNPEVEFRLWLNKHWQLCHTGGTLYQRRGYASHTKKYNLEMLRELFNEGWQPEDNSDELLNDDKDVQECDATKAQ